MANLIVNTSSNNYKDRSIFSQRFYNYLSSDNATGFKFDTSKNDQTYDEIMQFGYVHMIRLFTYDELSDNKKNERGLIFSNNDFEIYTDCGAKYEEISKLTKDQFGNKTDTNRAKTAIGGACNGENVLFVLKNQNLSENEKSWNNAVIPLNELHKIVFFDKENKPHITDFMKNNKYENSEQFLKKLQDHPCTANDDYQGYGKNSGNAKDPNSKFTLSSVVEFFKKIINFISCGMLCKDVGKNK